MLSYTDLLRLSFADMTDIDNDSSDTTVYGMLTIEQVMKQPTHLHQHQQVVLRFWCAD